MSTAQKLSRKCRQSTWRHLFLHAASSLAASGGILAANTKNPVTMRVLGLSGLAAFLAPCWRDHAAMPPHPYRVAATGGIWLRGMPSLWITRQKNRQQYHHDVEITHGKNNGNESD